MSPFQNCRPEQKSGGEWYVGSDYWALPMVSEAAARRTAEIIRGAYEAGYRAKAGEFRRVLGLDSGVE